MCSRKTGSSTGLVIQSRIRFCLSDWVEQYRSTGKERDSDTNLDYFGARYFSGAQGRFTSADPVGGDLANPQSLNRYTYVLNNPLRFTDPTGLYTCRDTKDGSCTSDQDQAFEKTLDALRGKKGDVGRAAAAYGTAGDANGVTVGFADLTKKGESGNAVSTIGYADGALRANSDVTIGTGLSGTKFTETIGHEGSHVADAQDVVASGLTPLGEKIYAGQNITPYSSEQRAYGVSNTILGSANETSNFACGAGTCTLGRGVLPSQVPGIVDNILRSNSIYNVNGKPMASNNPGTSVVNGVVGQLPKATVPK